MESQILNDVFKMTCVREFNIAMNNYNIQGLYERKKNHFVNTYFDGNVLKYSATMRAIFDKFQTTEQEQRAKYLNDKMSFLLKDIRSAKKYKQFEKYTELSKQYNEMATEHAQLNKGILELANLFKLHTKTKK